MNHLHLPGTDNASLLGRQEDGCPNFTPPGISGENQLNATPIDVAIGNMVSGPTGGQIKNDKWIAQSTSKTPTQQTYQELQDAYSFFNQRLFDGQLPECLITMQRHARSLGFFCSSRFVSAARHGERVHEIALNPSFFAARTEAGVLSTLVHEMGHLWRFHFSGAEDRPRRGYHCRRWADRMIALGLCPSDTGAPGGRETGYQMSHYIVENGPFDVTCRELLRDGFRFSWLEDNSIFGILTPVKAKATEGTDGSNRWKYTCSACGFNAWAKPNALIVCGFCNAASKLMERAIRG